MKWYNKTGIIILLLCVSSALRAQLLPVIGSVKGAMGGEKIVFNKLSGGQLIPIDSVVLKLSDNFTFSIPAAYKGICRINIDNKDYFDLIINNESIEIALSKTKSRCQLQVLKSVENITYYDYLESVQSIDDSINLLTAHGQKLYEVDKVKNKTELDKIVVSIDKLTNEKNKLALTFADKYSNLFVAEIIKADAIPLFADYLTNEKTPVFKTEFEFLKYHYLDNIDFSDSALLNTSVIYDVCGDYIRYFSNPPSVKTYKQIIDILYGKVSANKAIREYVTEILLKSFDTPSWEDVYTYIADNYYLNNTCALSIDSANIVNKSLLIKKLKPGNPAPEVIIINGSDTTFELSSLESKYTLVFFWASWCEFCEEAMPQISEVYSEYHLKGLEIVSISADTVATVWQTASLKNEIKWINQCDLKGFASPVSRDYNIVRTPNFFLLDKNKLIIGHYYNAAAVRKKLDQLILD